MIDRTWLQLFLVLTETCVKATGPATEAPKTGLAASRFANVPDDDEAAAVGGTGLTAEGERDHSSATLALVRKPLATCSLYLSSLQLTLLLFLTSLGCAIRQTGGSVLTDVTVKLARMKSTVLSLESLDSDMRESNLSILRELEEATTAQIPTDTNQERPVAA